MDLSLGTLLSLFSKRPLFEMRVKTDPSPVASVSVSARRCHRKGRGWNEDRHVRCLVCLKCGEVPETFNKLFKIRPVRNGESSSDDLTITILPGNMVSSLHKSREKWYDCHIWSSFGEDNLTAVIRTIQ